MEETYCPIKGEGSESEEFEDSRENLPSKGPIEPSSTNEQAPTPINAVYSSQPSMSIPSSGPTSQGGMGQDIMREGSAEDDCLNHMDLIKDMKFYQDATLDYQNAYEVLYVQQVEPQSKYSMQTYLTEEASAAIKVAKAKVQQWHQELLDTKCDCQSEIESAVSRAVE